MIVSFSLACALAQEPAATGPVLADAFVPSAFAGETLAVPDGDPLRVGLARAVFTVARPGSGDATHLYDVTGAVWLVGGAAVGPLRLGGALGVGLGAGPQVTYGRANDVSLEAGFLALEAQGRRPGFGVLGRVMVPLTVPEDEFALGRRGVGWEAGVHLDGQVGVGWIGGWLGWRGLPTVAREAFVHDDQLAFRLGGATRVADHWRVALEVDGGVGLLQPVTAATAPVELRLLATWTSMLGLEARFGLRTGLVPGAVGTPAIGAVVTVGWLHRPGVPD